jgi:hypothetical protein
MQVNPFYRKEIMDEAACKTKFCELKNFQELILERFWQTYYKSGFFYFQSYLSIFSKKILTHTFNFILLFTKLKILS